MTCKREKKTTSKTALCVAFSTAPSTVYMQYLLEEWKKKKNKRQNKQSSTCTVHTHIYSKCTYHIHMESVSRTIFSVSHLIVHPKYVRIISRYSTCCAARSHRWNLFYFHRCCWKTLLLLCTGLRQDFSLFFDLVCFFPSKYRYRYWKLLPDTYDCTVENRILFIVVAITIFSFKYLGILVKNVKTCHHDLNWENYNWKFETNSCLVSNMASSLVHTHGALLQLLIAWRKFSY